jgi:FkbM family methyltransferase
MRSIDYWRKFFSLYSNWPQIILQRLLGKGVRNIILKNNISLSAQPDAQLAVICDEVFLLKRYTNIHNLKINKGDIVLDLGAHVGVFSIFASQFGPRKIIAYEPEQKNFTALLRNIKSNKIKNIAANKAAVSNSSKILKLFIKKFSSNNTSSKFSKKFELVKSTTIAKIINEEKLDKIDFLKIDCEGCEGKIFKDISQTTLTKIRRISMEYHDNLSIMKHTEIANLLVLNNFSVELNKTGLYTGYIYAQRGLLARNSSPNKKT